MRIMAGLSVLAIPIEKIHVAVVAAVLDVIEEVVNDRRVGIM